MIITILVMGPFLTFMESTVEQQPCHKKGSNLVIDLGSLDSCRPTWKPEKAKDLILEHLIVLRKKLFEVSFSPNSIGFMQPTARWYCPGKLTCPFPKHFWRLVSFSKGGTNSSPLQIGRAPKGNNRIPTIHFQVRLLLVSGRENYPGG